MRNTKALAAVASLSALLAACSGGESEPAEPAATEEAATEEAAPAEAEAEAPAETAEAGTEVTLASLTGDAAAGKTVFAQCRSCHVTDEGVNRTGPSLHAVVGRESGTVEGFNYSDANASSDVTWTEDVLFEYLEDPRGFMPGTKMVFPGLKDPQDRANVIAYLKDPS